MDDSPLIFADGPETEVSRIKDPFWKVMVIDDEKSVHDITRLALGDFLYEGRGLYFIHAYSANEAKACLVQHPDTALMLVDVVMESEDAGLSLVQYVREKLKNDLVQMVIRTGQPGSAPEDQVISRYRINSYFSKTEVTAQKLVSLVTTSLRTYQLALAVNDELKKRKKAEQKLLALNRDLEEKIRRRTRELSKANQMKSLFLANMSHEIRTPMNGIIGMVNLLLGENLTERQKEFAAIIQTSANSLLTLINDILDLSKIEAGQLQFEIRPFSLEALIRETLAMFRVKAEEKGLSLSMAVDSRLPEYLAGDMVRVKQILVNLLGNAVKFTEKGSVSIRGWMAEDLGTHVRLTLEVTDTGPGIDDAFKEKLFDMFSQQDTSITRRYGGTGLGLAITKQLAAMMEGGIVAWNRQEGGAVFKVDLRLLKSDAGLVSDPDQDKMAQRISGLETKIRTLGLKILVAEDNPINQKVVSLLLEKMKIQAQVAENGEQVLEKLGQSTYDMVLMDVQMPVLDGLAATRRIRNSKKAWHAIPIIALTAQAMPEDAKACLEAGMDQVLTKPIHPRTLVQALGLALGL